MLQVGDFVVSSTNGVCEIVEEVEQDWTGENMPYFLLLPLDDRDSKIYIPIDKAEQRIRRIMDFDEAKDFICHIDSISRLEIQNERFCEREYKDAIFSGEPVKIAGAIKTIYERIQKRHRQGKKTTAIDDRYFKIAVHLLHSELAYALGCNEDEIEGNIRKAIALAH